MGLTEDDAKVLTSNLMKTVGIRLAMLALGACSLGLVIGTRSTGLAAAPGCSSSGVIAIEAVQGSGPVSPLAGQVVTVRGVVTANFSGENQLGGVFVQDAGPSTPVNASPGLFVEVGPSGRDLRPGMEVQLTGAVRELGGSGGRPSMTELDSLSGMAVCGTRALPEPMLLAFPLPKNLEPFEGALVSLRGPLVVSDVYQLGRYGELTVSPRRLFSPTNDNGLGDSATSGDALRLVVDDGSDAQYPAPTPYLSGAGLDATRRDGDQVGEVTGVLAFLHGVWLIEPTATLSFVNANPRPARPPEVGGNFRVASFNVLNFFTSLDSGRGATNGEEFARQRAKLVAALRGLNADVVGLTELENNGPTAVANLAAALNAALGGPVYAFTQDPATGTGTDLIKVGFLYKQASVKLVGFPLSDPNEVNLRLPVAQVFEPVGKANARFIAIINHFKAKSGCPNDGALDADAGQGCWNDLRRREAEALAGFAGRVQSATGVKATILLGDFNAYAAENPMLSLQRLGYELLTNRIPAAERYSYVYMGQAGSLDHALVNATLTPLVTGVTEWRINADEPPSMDYTTARKNDDRYQPTPFRSSDHDPVLIGLHF